MDFYVYIMEKPQGSEYDPQFQVIYGFKKKECDECARIFTDQGFSNAYLNKSQIKNVEEAQVLANKVNKFLRLSNTKAELDINNLEKLIALNGDK
jgi:ribosomal protein S9